MQSSTKTCTRCRAEKPVSEFYLRPDRGPAALKSKCKPCASEVRRGARVSATPEDAARALETARQWKRENVERVAAKQAAWNAANPEKCAASAIKSSARWRAENRELSVERSLASRAKKPEQYKAYNAAWQKANAPRCRAKYKAYMTRKANAMPSWANEFYMREAYALAQMRTKMFGFTWHVDHSVPLNSRTVCGLHTHDNLQVIPSAENLRKGNRTWPGMPA